MTEQEIINEYAKAGAAFLDAPFGSLAEKAARFGYRHWEMQYEELTGRDFKIMWHLPEISDLIRSYRKHHEKSDAP